MRRFAFFGALNPAKGVLTLFRAFHALRVPGVSLCVCGGGPLRPFLALLCLRDRRIRLAGPAARRDLPALYAQSDCVVIPSLTAESFSLVLSEAAACGCMMARLAFSISSQVRPDVLILDEVLAVGDGAFQKKSEQKMLEIIGGGATTILVSHALDQVRRMCGRVLWLEHGEQIAFGETAEICDRYQAFLDEKCAAQSAK